MAPPVFPVEVASVAPANLDLLGKIALQLSIPAPQILAVAVANAFQHLQRATSVNASQAMGVSTARQVS
jgi:hypothetical protein